MKILKKINDITACVIVLIALISLSSCMSTTPMFDNYIEYEYPHLSKFKVQKSKMLKGVNLTFKEYLKDFDGVDSSLIVFYSPRTFGNLPNFDAEIHFIKDYKLDKSYRFDYKGQNPKNIDSIVNLGKKYVGAYYFDFFGDFINENGVENINKISDTKYCGFSSGEGFTVITFFNPNLDVVYSHSFPRTLDCADVDFMRKMKEEN